MSDFTWDFNNPLARAKHERGDASAALWDYAQMGPGRSLRRLHKAYREGAQDAPETAPHVQRHPPTRRLKTIKNWSARYAWQDRVARWEELQKEEEAAEWARRRGEWREDVFQLSRQGLARLEEMLSWPLAEQVVEEESPDGQPMVITVRPVRWTILHAARLLEATHKVASLALGEVTERQEQIHSGSILAQTAAELESLEDQELDDRIRELSEKLSAPGPDTLRPPAFGETEEEEADGRGDPEGAQGQGDGPP